jgi:nucleoside 2-deoxyribosyltransferase
MQATSDTRAKKFVFTLMPFTEAFDDIYKLGIKPACESAGAYCERIDEQIFVENILLRIYDQINKADLIVADMTGRNSNVFYETGYAHALNKKVILLTRAADDIPFDLKHYPHIVYSGRIAVLKDELQRRIQWYLDQPEQAVGANKQFEQRTQTAQEATTPPATAMPVKTPPIIGIMLHDTVIEGYIPGLNYPRKLRLYLSNEGSDIDLGRGKWITEGVGLQAGKPSTCEYEVKNHLGKWTGESSFKTVYSGQWFRLYVGLDSTMQEEKLKAMAKNHSLGILEIPARTDETDVVIKIRP